MPDWSHALRQRLGGLRLRSERLAEMVEELSQHLDERHAELCSSGIDPQQAQRLALAEIDEGELPARLRPLRQSQQPEPLAPGAGARPWWQDLWQDLRLAGRMLRQQPAFAAVAILTLALGIGANAAIFALVDATLLRALPLPDAERVLFLSESNASGARSSVSPLNLRDWSSRSRSFDAFGGYQPNVASMVMSNPDGSGENVARQWVTAGLFDALGLQAVRGRLFSSDDDQPDLNWVAISERFWRQRFNADPSLVGQQLKLDGELYTVVGIAPQAAELVGRSDVWAMASFADAEPRLRTAYFLSVVARMRPGVELAAAQAELDAISAQLASEYPDSNAGRGARAESLQAVLIGGDLRTTALLFLGVVALVLLVCCANVASLLLARASARNRELAIRAALGASRGRVMRQLLAESLLLGLLGGLLGMALGALILGLAPALMPERLLPEAVTLQFDWRLVGFCLLVAVSTALLFGLAPAWQATGSAPARAIGADARSVASSGGRLRSLLVIGQVATAVALLFVGGLLLRTLLALNAFERGHGADNVLTMMVDPLGSRYPTAADVLRFYDGVESEVTGLPEVRNAAWATTLPLGDSSFGDAFISQPGQTNVDPQALPTADYQIVSASFFDTVELPLLAGRGFDGRDQRESVPVAIVSADFARQHLAAALGQAGATPEWQRVIGQRVAVRTSTSADAPTVEREIIGVATQVRRRADEAEGYPQIYVPLAQSPVGDIFLLVRPQAGAAAALLPRVREAIHRIDTEQLVSLREVSTLEAIASAATARHRFRAVLVGVFAGLVLTLAMVGVFGLLAYTVQQRQRDLGLRMALGASPRRVLGQVLRSAVRPLLAGALLGLVLALAAGPTVGAMLYGVPVFDPLTLLLVVTLLSFAALLATLAPAWRAMRVDPVVILRGD